MLFFYGFEQKLKIYPPKGAAKAEPVCGQIVFTCILFRFAV